MAIAREVWLNMVEDNLYSDYLKKVKEVIKDDSTFAYTGGGVSVVHIPNAGTAATVTKGNSTYPVAVTKRTDSDNSYSLSNFEVGPVLVQIKDGQANSYDQTESILNDQLMGLGESVGRSILVGQWHYTSGLYVNTTGSAVAAHAPSATGNRKALTGADVKKALGIFGRNSVPDKDLYLVTDMTMAWQLLDDIGYTTYRDAVAGLSFAGSSEIETIPLWNGVKMVVLPQVVYATSAGVVREVGATGATTDVAAAYLIQKGCTSMAMTDIVATVDVSPAGYFGDTYEASVMAGGKYRRTDKMGVIPIVGVSA